MTIASDTYARNVLATYHRAMINQPMSIYPYKDSMQGLIDYWSTRYPSWWDNFRQALGTGSLTINEHNEVMTALAGRHAGFVPTSPSDLFQGLADKTQDWSISKIFSVTAEEAGKTVEAAAETGREMFSNLGTALKYAPYVALGVGALILVLRFKGGKSLMPGVLK